jgi:calcineurin-like phosphoesterase family protein
MVETFFTSDSHFGHKNILEYEKDARPFKTIEEMNEKLIDNWNSVVGVKDIVYHLGDFAFGQRNINIAGRLNGRKKLVMGNHDNYPSSLYLVHFEKLYGCVFWERCVLSHMPVHPNGLGARWMLNVHGHLHSKKVMMNYARLLTETGQVLIPGEVDLNYFNVSVEQHNLTPIHRDVIMERLKEL